MTTAVNAADHLAESASEEATLTERVRAHLWDGKEGTVSITRDDVRKAILDLTNRAWVAVPLVNKVFENITVPVAPPKDPPTNGTATQSGPRSHVVPGTTPPKATTPPKKDPPPPPTEEEIKAARKARREKLVRQAGIDEVFSSKTGVAHNASVTTYLRIESLRIKVQGRTVSVWTSNGWQTVVSLSQDEDAKDCAILAYEVLVGPWVPKKKVP